MDSISINDHILNEEEPTLQLSFRQLVFDGRSLLRNRQLPPRSSDEAVFMYISCTRQEI